MRQYLSTSLSRAILTLLGSMALLSLQSCGDDDSDDPAGSPNIRLFKVDAVDDKFYLKNFGTAAQDVSDYWICNLKSYAQLNTLSSGDLVLDPDEMIAIDRPLDDDASDVGLYSENTFTSADAMVDFMQYGEDVGTNGRVNVAVEKGIWTAGEFVDGLSPFDYTGNGTQNGAGFWSNSGTATPNVRLFSVDADADQVTLKNFGNGAQDLTELWLCNKLSYAKIGDFATGDLILDPDETIVLDRILDDNSSDVGLYNAQAFTSATAMLDFMQYGEDIGAGGRVNVAVTKGIWTAGEFVESGTPYDYTGNGDQNGASFWSNTPAPNVRLFNIATDTDQITLKNFGNAAQDLTELWLCNRKSYIKIGNIPGLDLTLDPNETIVIDRTLDDVSSDVGLYNAQAFTSADAMMDFMQYGADIGTDGRVDVAVTKGIWAAGEFVENGTPYDYTGNGNENGAGFWTNTITPNVRLFQVNATTDQITLKNFGNGPQDLTELWLCNRKSYVKIGDIPGINLTLAPNETIVLDRTLDNTSSDVGLFNAQAFTSANAMMDFMQYGADIGTDGRVDVAVTKGIWAAGEFVANGSPYDYTGDGDQNGVGQWQGQ